MKRWIAVVSLAASLPADTLSAQASPGSQIAELTARRDTLRVREAAYLQQAADLSDSLRPRTGDHPVRMQQFRALLRQAEQAACHALGKDLAIAELELASGLREAGARIESLSPMLDECIASGKAAAEVWFGTADGGRVFGRLYGSGLHAVVLAHGGRFTKESWQDQAAALTAVGLRLLAIDFRGRGRSRGPLEHAPGDEYHDVLAAIQFLARTGSDRISLVGASFGGAAAAQAAIEAGPGLVDAVVLLAPSVIEDPAGMPGRKLYIVAEDDVRGGGVRRLDEIRAQYEATPSPKKLVVLPGSAHAQYLFDTEQSEPLLHTIRDFLLAD